MTIGRRQMLAGAVVTALASPGAAASPGSDFGLIGRIKAKAGSRAQLAAALAEGSRAMPGCVSYIVAEDAAEPDTLWVTEVWDSEASHKASLKLPQIRAAIAKGRPLIASFETIATTRPISGT